MSDKRFKVYHRHFSDRLQSDKLIPDGMLILEMADFEEFRDPVSKLLMESEELAQIGITEDLALPQIMERLEWARSQTPPPFFREWREKFESALFKKTPCADVDRIEADAVSAYRNSIDQVLSFCREGVESRDSVSTIKAPVKVKSLMEKVMGWLSGKGKRTR